MTDEHRIITAARDAASIPREELERLAETAAERHARSVQRWQAMLADGARVTVVVPQKADRHD